MAMQPIATLVACFGLMALATGAPADTDSPTSFAGPTRFWVNTPTPRHHDERKDIVRCGGTADSDFSNFRECDSYCFRHDNGVARADMGEGDVGPSGNSKTSSLTPDVHLITRDTLFGRLEHYECSKDRTGVLICRYGFCSTDHYCKSQEECSVDSFTCETKSSYNQNKNAEFRAMGSQPKMR